MSPSLAGKIFELLDVLCCAMFDFGLGLRGFAPKKSRKSSVRLQVEIPRKSNNSRKKRPKTSARFAWGKL